jgi:DNA-binding response OmpR family regulator
MVTGAVTMQTDTYQITDQPGNLKPLVLIVENDRDSREMLRTLLEIWGYRTAECEDGEKSIEIAVNDCPNLILMDVSLSKTDGVTIMRRMREIDSLQGVPIVFISGHAQPEFRTFALTVGGDDFLVKPVDFNQLEIILKRFIGENIINVNSGGLTV